MRSTRSLKMASVSHSCLTAKGLALADLPFQATESPYQTPACRSEVINRGRMYGKTWSHCTAVAYSEVMQLGLANQ